MSGLHLPSGHISTMIARASAPLLAPQVPMSCPGWTSIVSIFLISQAPVAFRPPLISQGIDEHRRSWRKSTGCTTQKKYISVRAPSTGAEPFFFLVCLLSSVHHPSFRFVRFFLFGFSSGPVLHHETSLRFGTNFDTHDILGLNFTKRGEHRGKTRGQERKKIHRKQYQNVRTRKKAECLSGLYQIREATTIGIHQRLGRVKASTISGINPPPALDCSFCQHACGYWQVGQCSSYLTTGSTRSASMLTHHAFF